MKNKSLALLFILTSVVVNAQKEDYTWLFGYNYNTITNDAEEIRFSFKDSFNISFRQRPMPLRPTNAVLSDSTGSLLLYTNGCYIANKNDAFIENSEGLNPGYLYNDNCIVDSIGYPTNQSAMFLPHPVNNNLKYLFHVGSYFSINPLIAFDDKLYYTVVDISSNGGEGKVISKNNVIVQDTFDNDGFHAVRHANGRDWWIVIPKLQSNKYFVSLFSPQGIITHIEEIGLPTETQVGGELVFSPDGSKMARFNIRDDLRIFDFDRCTGMLLNPIHIPIVDNADDELFAGLSFSADGHYLYAAEVKRLLQFDMWSSDIASSKIVVAETDLNTNCTFGKSISYMELAPDGRIYCRPLNGQSCMHRLGKPERPASDCDFQQYYYSFDNSAYKNMPHFPNFRLGPIDNSLCDTLGLDNHPMAGWRYDQVGGLSMDFTSVSWYEPTAWLWEFGNPLLGSSSEKNPSFTFPTSGIYQVCLTVSNIFGYNTLCRLITIGTNSTNDNEIQKIAQISPTPFGEYISVETGSDILSPNFILYDEIGRRLISKQLETTLNQVDTKKLMPGIYFWEVRSAGKVIKTGKTIKVEK